MKAKAGQVVEQVVRPTGLVDPMIEVRPAGLGRDLFGEPADRCAR
jgi:excinuclease ABC subunit B